MNDTDSNHCLLCHQLFTLFNRKHHCRLCGILICANCSRKN